ncbi:PAX-interacting protein 1 [Biomphalaria glabrata]|uniref:PAX-interacting protein 1 n=1 Tax=Biomphalaria glabrata TaxID=6526 RepID=A0A9W3BMK1_BIOGL|nr:PAX-interacting protein 1-like [Biomphalaria glabrata]KAI8761064.1 PAX-interacting protein 1 [Biomphalaria glabrata]
MGSDTETNHDDLQHDVFKGVTYYIVGNISDKVTSLLDQNGAKRDSYLSEMVSIVIADSTTSDDYSEAKELFELPIVSSEWVILSAKCKKQLKKEIFFLEGKLFSGIVACPSELDSEDVLAIWGMLIYHGARCQSDLDETVTHLITSSTSSAKYTAAVEHKDTIKIVTPDWIVDSVAKSERQNEEIYHPKLLQFPKPQPPSPPNLMPEPPPEYDLDSPYTSFMDTLPPHEMMDVSPNHSIFSVRMGNNKVGQLDDRLESPRPDTPSAKEALARKISSRISSKSSSEPTTPERLSVPLQPVNSPGSSSASRVLPPIPPVGMQPRMDQSNIRNTLRNITNRAVAPASSVPVRSTMPQQGPKMNPLVAIPTMPSQTRPPPPEYPFPPKPIAAPLPIPQHQPPAVPLPSAPPPATSGPQPPPPGPLYHGHDPKENVPPDLCLLGCVFCIVDYQNIIGLEEVAAWKKVIEQYGGQVETSYCNRVSHVLCANQKSDVFKMALKEGKRVVTAFWLNDCLLQKKMVPPWQALHLPLSFHSEKPGFNQMISVTNFDGEERVRLKQMINAIGAKYTGYMTHHNSALICKKPGGMKFEKAKEWRIAVVNVQWLSDLVLGNMDALRLPVHVRYLQVGQGREFHMDLTRVTHLMGGWKTTLKITKETWKRFKPHIQATNGQENTINNGPSPPKRQKVDSTTLPPDVDPGVPKVLFTLYSKSQASRLETIVKKLGGCTVTNPRHCTHLVCPSLVRTIKFFVAINTCRYVVTKEWLEDSSIQERFLDESDYALKDESGEAAFNCTLSESLGRARSKPLFQGLTFYITPSVAPPICELTSIIESAGGIVVKRRPTIKQISASVDEKGHPKVIVITCLNDLHLSVDLRNRKIPVFNAEFVLTGVMRQEVDYNTFRIVTTQ